MDIQKEIAKNEKVLKERYLEIKKEVEWDFVKAKVGGQVAGLQPIPVILRHRNLGFEIKIDYYRSHYKNKEACMEMFELWLMYVVR